MKILKEITKWHTEYIQPNHTYFVEGNKCIAYIKEGTTRIVEFSKPLMFSTSFRKFKDITSEMS